MPLVDIHARLATTAALYLFICGVWGLWSYFRGRTVGPSYRGALAIAEMLIVGLGLLGLILFLMGLRPRDSLHILYGVTSAIALPGAYIYTLARSERSRLLIYALVSLFVFGLILRGIATG